MNLYFAVFVLDLDIQPIETKKPWLAFTNVSAERRRRWTTKGTDTAYTPAFKLIHIV